MTTENIQIEDTTTVANIDTLELQQFSVQQFMQRLGYVLCRTDRQGLVFVLNDPRPAERRLVSYNTAIRLHNSELQFVGDGTQVKSADPLQDTVIDTYIATQALAAKVVQKVKIQYSKKNKMIVLPNESDKLVKFTNPVYATTFLGLPPAAPAQEETEVQA